MDKPVIATSVQMKTTRGNRQLIARIGISFHMAAFPEATLFLRHLMETITNHWGMCTLLAEKYVL